MARSPRASMTAIPCSPMVPDSSTLSPGCTRSRDSRPAFRDHADARGRDEDAVGGALADDLGVAGDDLHTGPGRRFGHVGDDFAQFGDGEALLDDEGRRKPLRACTRHREVVDRAVHRDGCRWSHPGTSAAEPHTSRWRTPAARPTVCAALRRRRAARVPGCGTPPGTPRRPAPRKTFRPRRAPASPRRRAGVGAAAETCRCVPAPGLRGRRRWWPRWCS